MYWLVLQSLCGMCFPSFVPCLVQLTHILSLAHKNVTMCLLFFLKTFVNLSKNNPRNEFVEYKTPSEGGFLGLWYDIETAGWAYHLLSNTMLTDIHMAHLV